MKKINTKVQGHLACYYSATDHFFICSKKAKREQFSLRLYVQKYLQANQILRFRLHSIKSGLGEMFSK